MPPPGGSSSHPRARTHRSRTPPSTASESLRWVTSLPPRPALLD
jgi:hypothetical protein